MVGRDTAPGYLPGLTGLRGVGAVWVVLFHMQLGHNIRILKSGYLGVDLFFILSGFVLAHVYLASSADGRIRSLPAFFGARVARVVPLHVFALLVTVAGSPWIDLGISNPPLTGGILASNFLLLQELLPGQVPSLNPPSWSLSQEMLGYLLFPALAAGAWRLRSHDWIVACICGLLTMFVAAALVNGYRTPHAFYRTGHIRMVCEITSGILLYRLRPQDQSNIPAAWSFLAVGLLAGGLAYDPLSFAAIYGLAGIVGLSVCPGTALAALMRMRVMQYLGKISFSIYLLHWLPYRVWRLHVVPVATGPLEILLVSAGFLICMWGIAALGFHLVENPSRRWLQNLQKRWWQVAMP